MKLRHADVDVGDGTLHVVEAGDPSGRPYLLLHGWPECWQTWISLLTAADPGHRLIAVDLPGVGGSTAKAASEKLSVAARIHDLVRILRLTDLTLIGHDVGGMVTYAYVRNYHDIARAVIMNTVIPGLEPWTDVLKNPRIWLFAFHNVPTLPERLVQGRQATYFDYFYDVLSVDRSKISAESRAANTAAYESDSALATGFDWFRAFDQDACDNTAPSVPTHTPVLYIRGQNEGLDVAAYAAGLRKAGVEDLTTATVPDVGHFAQEEAPEEVWRLIREFAEAH